MSEFRTYFVPDGLAGERVDVGVSRLTGLSRTKAGELVDEGKATVDRKPVGRSRRLLAGNGSTLNYQIRLRRNR